MATYQLQLKTSTGLVDLNFDYTKVETGTIEANINTNVVMNVNAPKNIYLRLVDTTNTDNAYTATITIIDKNNTQYTFTQGSPTTGAFIFEKISNWGIAVDYYNGDSQSKTIAYDIKQIKIKMATTGQSASSDIAYFTYKLEY